MTQPATIENRWVAPTVRLPERGDEWRRLRREAGLSVGELAEITGLHRGTISRLEHNDPRVSDRVRRIVASALGISIWPRLWPEGR